MSKNKFLKNTHENLLEYVPVKSNPYIHAKEDDDSNITLVIKRESKLDKFLLKIFRKAHRELYVHLDDIGSYAWKNIDGKKTVYELAEDFRKDYNVPEIEAMNRMGKFIKILKNNKFIQVKKFC
ncbi:PqqD family protein [Haloimpatiens sp. FM7330]|uniref:PqqD family protein n=1 Tax=Haloimpatiens sp. FM7330 TaxID=3298610 RepID=UPI00363F27FC